MLLTGCPVALAALYLLGLAAAGAGSRPAAGRRKGRVRFAALIPAHNEAEMIGRCVDSLVAQDYPRDRYRVVVVADNCTDATANIARARGAQVMVRQSPSERGKGYALRWAVDRLLGQADPFDALVVVDADSFCDRGFLSALAIEFAAGNEVAQADDLLDADPEDARAQLEALALLLRNRVRLAGRAALGLPASLCGNGMMLSRRVLTLHPWNAFSGTEDGEYSLTLAELGVHTRFALGAKVYAAPTKGGRGAYTQAVRWEGGRFRMMRVWIPRLISAAWTRRDGLLLSTALDVAMPPLGLLCALAVLGAVASGSMVIMGAIPPGAAIPWLLAVLALPAYVALGIATAGMRAPARKALAALPGFLWLKVRVYLGLVAGRHSNTWIRTQRPAEADNNHQFGG